MCQQHGPIYGEVGFGRIYRLMLPPDVFGGTILYTSLKINGVLKGSERGGGFSRWLKEDETI